MAKRPRRSCGNDSRYTLELLRVDAGEQHVVRVLSVVGDRIMGCLTHWDRRQSFYCGPHCPAKRHCLQTQWKGYLSVERWEHTAKAWFPWVLEVTEAAELDMRGQVGRGQVWLLNRALDEKGHKAPVRATLTEQLQPEAVSLAFGMDAVLWRVYRDTRVELTVANPMPDRVWVEPVQGAPPACMQPDPAEKPVSPEEFRAAIAQARRDGRLPNVQANGQVSNAKVR